MTESPLLLPPEARLLHIGPHKTGTTAIQGALRLARPVMKDHGVIYAGETRQHYRAALAITGGKGLIGDPANTMFYWERLVRDTREAGRHRVVISSEYFDAADDETAARIVSELGGDAVHIAITLRSLNNILPSAWQQYVRNRLQTSYEDWLNAMFNKPPFAKPTKTFWQRHRHDELVARWASVVGPDRVVVVMIDSGDRDYQLRVFEQLLGLPAGLLEPEVGWANRSLTFGEAELVRTLNKRVKAAEWTDQQYARLIRDGVSDYLQANRTPGADEPRAQTPRWAVERAAETGAEAAAAISALGVRIVGDINLLGELPPEPAEPARNVATLPSDVAAEAVIGVVAASGVRDPKPVQPKPAKAKTSASVGQPRLQNATGPELRAEVSRRVRRRARKARRRLHL